MNHTRLHADTRRNRSDDRNQNGARRQAILDAALQLFAGKALSSVSGREIALKANVSVRLIWHHFGTKEALQQEIDQLIVTKMRDAAQSLEGDIDARITTVFERYRLLIEEYGSAFSDYFRGMITDKGKRGEIAYQSIKKIFEAMKLFEFPKEVSVAERRHREIAIMGILQAWPLFRPHLVKDYGVDIYSEKEYKHRIRATVIAVKALQKA